VQLKSVVGDGAVFAGESAGAAGAKGIGREVMEFVIGDW
jgi:hypothetical protein